MQAREGSVSLTVDVSDACVVRLRTSYLNADHNKLTVVMRNLLSNAIKFSKVHDGNNNQSRIAPSKTVQVLVDIVEFLVESQIITSHETGAELPQDVDISSMLRIRVVDSGVGIAEVNPFKLSLFGLYVVLSIDRSIFVIFLIFDLR